MVLPEKRSKQQCLWAHKSRQDIIRCRKSPISQNEILQVTCEIYSFIWVRDLNGIRRDEMNGWEVAKSASSSWVLFRFTAVRIFSKNENRLVYFPWPLRLLHREANLFKEGRTSWKTCVCPAHVKNPQQIAVYFKDYSNYPQSKIYSVCCSRPCNWVRALS